MAKTIYQVLDDIRTKTQDEKTKGGVLGAMADLIPLGGGQFAVEAIEKHIYHFALAVVEGGCGESVPKMFFSHNSLSLLE